MSVVDNGIYIKYRAYWEYLLVKLALSRCGNICIDFIFYLTGQQFFNSFRYGY